MNRFSGIILIALIALPLVDITLNDGWSLLTNEDIKKAIGCGLFLSSFVLGLIYVSKKRPVGPAENKE